jgi:hypothetical protein
MQTAKVSPERLRNFGSHVASHYGQFLNHFIRSLDEVDAAATKRTLSPTIS